MSEYKTIVFDLGNVVFNISFDKMFDYWAKVGGCEINRIKERFDEFDEMYYQFEKGEIKPNVYRKYLLEKLGLQLSDAEFDNGWNELCLDLVPGINHLLQSLRPSFRLISLTNTNEIHTQKWRAKYASVLSNFERIFCSHEIHARKPEKRIYEILLDCLREDPKSVLFLDDKEENVDAALECGMKGIVVSSNRQVIEDLNKLGINIKERGK
jgi:putative hydrolase of the HAD superfamily